ncbi:MAG: hypothetical protein FJ319_09200 [SAR202 cluster bacterium]|nr:hypothetical protein [SAR202 cluster bacterium]
MKDSDPHKRAYSAALRFLTLKPRSESEVRNRLARNFPEDIVDSTLQTLREEGRVDDALYASLWSQSRASLHPRSGRLIKRELSAKGIPPAIASQAIQNVDEADSAYRAGIKHAARLGHNVDLPTFQRKLWSYLQRRGFSDSLSRETTMRLWQESRLPGGPHDREGA